MSGSARLLLVAALVWLVPPLAGAQSGSPFRNAWHFRLPVTGVFGDAGTSSLATAFVLDLERAHGAISRQVQPLDPRGRPLPGRVPALVVPPCVIYGVGVGFGLLRASYPGEPGLDDAGGHAAAFSWFARMRAHVRYRVVDLTSGPRRAYLSVGLRVGADYLLGLSEMQRGRKNERGAAWYLPVSSPVGLTLAGDTGEIVFELAPGALTALQPDPSFRRVLPVRALMLTGSFALRGFW